MVLGKKILNADTAKVAIKTLIEQSENKKDANNTLKDAFKHGAATKKLWREGNKSKLIQIGMTLMVLPEPTPVTPTIGACFIAAGAVQKGIQSRSIYMEDITKTLQNTFKEIVATKYNLQI